MIMIIIITINPVVFFFFGRRSERTLYRKKSKDLIWKSQNPIFDAHIERYSCNINHMWALTQLKNHSVFLFSGRKTLVLFVCLGLGTAFTLSKRCCSAVTKIVGFLVWRYSSFSHEKSCVLGQLAAKNWASVTPPLVSSIFAMSR